MDLATSLCLVLGAGYAIAPRDPALLNSIAPGLGERAREDAAYMVFDPSDDAEGFLLTGDDIGPLLGEAAERIDSQRRLNASQRRAL